MSSLLFRAGVVVATLAPAMLAQRSIIPHSVQAYHLDSGYLSNPSATEQILFTGTVTVPGEDWVQLRFKDTNLPAGSRLRLTSLQDDALQWFDAHSLRDYGNASAFFNGNSVRVELLAAPGTTANRFLVESVMAGDAQPVVEETICGTSDDRTPSTDRRQGRTWPTGCTGWMINPTTMLTAGHCTGNNRQEQIHFQVPMSTNSGGLVLPPPQHQYPSDVSTMRRLSGGVGSDWAVMAINRNSNTGLYPGQVQRTWYQLGSVPPSVEGQTIRITGYGTTAGAVPRSWNQIQKTHTGPFVSSAGTTLRYAVDTTGGNSGSPIIHENTNTVIGIHTHAGCNTGGGSNQGTSIERPDIQSAVAAIKNIKTAGIVLSFGAGCAGSAGTPNLGTEDFPDIGNPMRLSTNQLPANQVGAMFLGSSSELWNGAALPMDLGSAGMTGCTLYVSPDLSIPVSSSSTGSSTVSFSIPALSSLIGQAFFAQQAVVDPGSNALGVIWSNAVSLIIGD